VEINPDDLLGVYMGLYMQINESRNTGYKLEVKPSGKTGVTYVDKGK